MSSASGPSGGSKAGGHRADCGRKSNDSKDHGVPILQGPGNRHSEAGRPNTWEGLTPRSKGPTPLDGGDRKKPKKSPCQVP